MEKEKPPINTWNPWKLWEESKSAAKALKKLKNEKNRELELLQLENKLIIIKNYARMRLLIWGITILTTFGTWQELDHYLWEKNIKKTNQHNNGTPTPDAIQNDTNRKYFEEDAEAQEESNTIKTLEEEIARLSREIQALRPEYYTDEEKWENLFIEQWNLKDLKSEVRKTEDLNKQLSERLNPILIEKMQNIRRIMNETLIQTLTGVKSMLENYIDWIKNIKEGCESEKSENPETDIQKCMEKFSEINGESVEKDKGK